MDKQFFFSLIIHWYNLGTNLQKWRDKGASRFAPDTKKFEQLYNRPWGPAEIKLRIVTSLKIDVD